MNVLDAISAYLRDHGVVVIKIWGGLRIYIQRRAGFDVSIGHPRIGILSNNERDMSIIATWCNASGIYTAMPIADPELMENIMMVVRDAGGQVSSEAS